MAQKPISYQRIKEVRNLLIKELSEQFPTLTMEHYQLAEMRLQTLAYCGWFADDSNDVGKEVKAELKRK